jgi:hypothetical protein
MAIFSRPRRAIRQSSLRSLKPMKQNSIRSSPESHLAAGLLMISALCLGFSGLGQYEDHIKTEIGNDVLIPHSDIISAAGTRYMVFPATTHPVRLYLIDTGIAHQAEWFSRNPKLQFGPSYAPLPTSTATLHGTRMLDIIAGPESGAVAGTPIEVISMNIYAADGLSTTVGAVADAVFEAVDLEGQTGNPAIPAVICLASGSPVLETSAILERAIDSAVEAGIPVLVSAGNSGQNASSFIPSKYGSKDGVICVGAYGKNLQPLPMSNVGPAVDLVAPGEGVKTLALPLPTRGGFQGMTGTSPATAIATAAAIYQLSKNPQLSPAGLEEILGTSVAIPAPTTLACSVTSDNDEKFLDVSFVSGQLLAGNAASGFSSHPGQSVAIEWSLDLQNWTVGRFTELGPPVEVSGGWRYSARSTMPVLTRTRFADLTAVQFAPRLITSVSINDAAVSLPRAPYQLPLQSSLLQEDLRAAGFSGAIVGGNGAGFRIHVPDVLYSTPNPGSWITWPPFVAGYDPLTGDPMISGGIGFSGTYHLNDGTPVDPPVQMARLRTIEAP